MLDIGPTTRGGIPLLCERLRRLIDGTDADVVACDARALAPDITGVEALARLQLTARSLGSHVRLRHVSADLASLIAFCGLGDAVTGRGDLEFGSGGQAEEREQASGVQEGVDRSDPPA